jgi:RHS repeat-associated protein
MRSKTRFFLLGPVLVSSALVSLMAAGSALAAPTPIVLQTPHLTNANAGTLSGSLEVDNDGASTYSIEVPVPPGTGGMTPRLALSYSSQGSNGMVGLGWSLQGLSTIHRCQKTIAQDGVPGRIRFNNADRLCLDGQRLLRISGTNPGTNVSAIDNAYWSTFGNDTQYRTEQESFRRVSRLTGGGFKVEGKDGRILYYGSTSSGLIKAQGRADGDALVWALDRVEDRVGNYLTVEYSQDTATGEYLPKQIRYGGNTAAVPAQAQDLAVRFVYETRADAQVAYVGGSRNDLRSRLTRIQSYTGTATNGTGGTLVREHAIRYLQSTSSGRSLVESIQACALNPQSGQNECLPKTSFEWGQAALAYREEAQFSSWQKSTGLPQTSVHLRADFDGDGLLDDMFPVVNTYCPVDPSCVRIPFDNGQGNENEAITVYTDSYSIRTASGLLLTGKFSFPGGAFPTNISKSLSADLNGDGLSDVVLMHSLPGLPTQLRATCLNSWSRVFSCSGFVVEPGGVAGSSLGGFAVVDLFNDQRAHLMSDLRIDCTLGTDQKMRCVELDAVNVNPPGSSLVDPLKMATFDPVAVDFSKQDISDFYSVFTPVIPQDLTSAVATCVHAPTVVSGKQRFECQTTMQWKGTWSPYVAAPRIYAAESVGDLNGDGLSDFVFDVGGVGVHICTSGETFADCKNTGSASWQNGSAIGKALVGDFVGDGMQRVVIQRTGSGGSIAMTDVCRINALQQLVCQTLTAPAQMLYARVEDPTGAGVPKFVVVASPPPLNPQPVQVSNKVYSLAAPASQDKLTAMTNGIGLREELTYARADDDSAVRMFAVVSGVEQKPVYPMTSRNAGVVVEQLKRSNGKGGWLQTDLYYEGAMADAQGRGSAGFAVVRRTDLPTGIVSTSTLRQDFPFVGQASRVRVTSRTGVVLSDTQNTFEQQTLSHANGARTTFAFMKQSVAARDDLDGSDLGTETTTAEYADGWGNRTKHRVSITGAGKTFSTETLTVYSNSSTSWLLGLPTSIKTTKTDPDTGSVTRTTTRAYSTTTGLLSSETVEPDVAQYEVATTYDRSGNPYGLVNKQVQTWRDPYTQTTKSRTVSDTAYDSKGRFPATIKNALGHPEQRTCSAATGAQLSLTGPNQLITTWTVDGFGRVLKELRADGTETRYYVKQCQSDCPVNATTATIAEQYLGAARTGVPSIVYADSAGHVLRTLTWGFDGRKIVTDRRYDALGRLSEEDHPRFESETAVLDQRTAFDDLGRVVESDSLDESGAEQSTLTRYNGMVTVVTNAKLQVRTETRNVIGQLTQVKDAKGGVTTFQYEPFGNLAKTVDPGGNIITVAYDRLGRRTQLRDPNLGWIEYSVDPLGQTWSQVNPKQRAASPPQKTRFEFDLLGRMTGRYEPDLESHWVFDTAAKGIGQLAEAYTGKSTAKDYRRTHTFDSLGRPSVSTQMLTDGNYTARTDYDTWGRPVKQTYQRGADGAKVYDSIYNAWGYLSAIQRSTALLWQVTAQDAANRPTTIKLGNGLSQSRSYSKYSTRLESAAVKPASGNARLQEAYHYDALGNVDQRSQYWDASGFDEQFSYDALNRLSSSQVTGQPKQTFAYDAIGNLTSKTGVGTFEYNTVTTWVMIDLDDISIPIRVVKPAAAGAGRPNAVSGVRGTVNGMTNPVFEYDPNGNLSSGAGRRIEWSSFDMPTKITRGSVNSVFAYAAEHQRAKQLRSDGTMILYAGAQETETKAGQVTIKTYWPGGIGVEIDRPGKPTELNWTHLDRLGSPIALTDAAGAIKEKLAYDAWGKRRTAEGSATPDTLDGQTDNKGYTGHEMLDQLDLVHMNGRVYDPLMARFISADPLIQDPADGQSYNRYSYVLNNPTNLTDPSGFASEGEKLQTCDDKCNRRAVLEKIKTAQHAGQTIVVVEADGSIGEVVTSAGGSGKAWSSSGRSAERGAAKGAGSAADGAIQRYQQCGSSDSGCIAAARTEMLGVRQAMRAEGVPLQERLGINANIAQASVLLGEYGEALDANAAVGIVALTNRAGGSAAKGLKPINLPSWKRIDVDMSHIASGHMAGGSRVSPNKDLFSENLSATQVERVVRQAYRYGERVATQGERVLVRGEYGGQRIEMWVNTQTRTIETAYPIN